MVGAVEIFQLYRQAIHVVFIQGFGIFLKSMLGAEMIQTGTRQHDQ